MNWKNGWMFTIISNFRNIDKKINISFIITKKKMKSAAIFIGIAILIWWLMLRKPSQNECNQIIAQGLSNEFSMQNLQKLNVVEDFVPSNARVVSKQLTSVVELDSLAMTASFRGLVNEDAGVFDIARFPAFQKTEPDRDTTNGYLNGILRRVNNKIDRQFFLLDLQSVGRESSYDPSDNGIVDKYMVNLFIQDKDNRRVHAAAYNMSVSFIVKPSANKLQLTELYFITDHFYKGPLVDGENKDDRYFRIKNTYFLNQPFYTSNDKVLLSDNEQIELLKTHHHDLRTPKYRCFDVEGAEAGNADVCNNESGYWDTPVSNPEECPFYRKNKNYVNNYGGIERDGGGYCEIPVGMKRVGFRHTSADPANKPQCYNCRVGSDGMPGSIGPCCDEQQNKQLYPNLVSPDYAFPSDPLVRGQSWAQLAGRGLHWAKHPTNTQDVTDPMQRQPVFGAIIGK